MLNNMACKFDQIISITDLSKNYKGIQDKLAEVGLGFIFKNNKPQEVIMSTDYYEYLMDKIVHLEDSITVLESKTDKTYSEDDIKNIIDLD